MEHDDIDRVLSRGEEIAPSSGFAAAVMDAVRSEAATPPPIPFPWRRALTGLAGCTLALVAFLTSAHTQGGGQSALAAVVESARAAGAGWIALALLVSLVSVILSMRLAGRNT